MNNERILELALAADPDIGRTLGDLNGKCWIAANGIRPQSVVKFAELIVRECAEISKKYAGGSMPVSIASAIKEHFGVGE